MMSEITKSQIERIGKAIKNNSATDEDLNIFSTWRSDHVLLTRDLAKTLKRKARQNKLKATISRRLKRQPSIFIKLTRFPSMQLDRMQDIGGVRIILKNIHDANDMSNILSNMYGINKKNSMFALKKPITDYITNPKKRRL
jgi:ppGpp synthetase/RelA/SpoT-type nucleotidyltranferase